SLVQRVLRLEQTDLPPDGVDNVAEGVALAGERHVRDVGIADADRRLLVRPGAGDDGGDVFAKLRADLVRLRSVFAQVFVQLGELGGVCPARVVGGVEARLDRGRQ